MMRGEDWMRQRKQCLFQPKIDDHFVEDCCEFKNEVVDGWKDSLGRTSEHVRNRGRYDY